MSIRTIVEINHDRAGDLSLYDIRQLVRDVIDTERNRELWEGRAVEIAPGVRVLARRHHSDGLTVRIGNGAVATTYSEPG